MTALNRELCYILPESHDESDMKELIAIAILVYWSGSSPKPEDLRAEIYTFGDFLRVCQPFEQSVSASYTRGIIGLSDGKCAFYEDYPGPQIMRCQVPEADLGKVAAAWNRTAEQIKDDGSVSLKYDSSDTESWTAFINSPACEFREEE